MPNRKKNQPEACAHHWDIETPAGPTSRGRCRHCGLEREFVNYWPDDPVNAAATARAKSRKGGKRAHSLEEDFSDAVYCH